MNKRSLRFHVRSNDLFGTVAAIVDLLRQDAERSGYRKTHSRMLRRLRDTLVYLQQKYRIIEGGNLRKMGRHSTGCGCPYPAKHAEELRDLTKRLSGLASLSAELDIR